MTTKNAPIVLILYLRAVLMCVVRYELLMVFIIREHSVVCTAKVIVISPFVKTCQDDAFDYD